MIKFTLKCEKDHQFDSWFQSTSAFDKLRRSGMLTCETCGSTNVEKAIMAPAVRSGREDTKGALSTPKHDAEKALKAIRKEIEEKSEYVGLGFATQARDMHEGLTPSRPIHGEAKPEDARKLIEDGVPVAPLPFIPNRKSN